jgi:hypothetical protein
VLDGWAYLRNHLTVTMTPRDGGKPTRRAFWNVPDLTRGGDESRTPEYHSQVKRSFSLRFPKSSLVRVEF